MVLKVSIKEYWSRLLDPLAKDAPHLGMKPESSYISRIHRNVLYHYCHLGSTKFWFKSTIFGSNTKKKKIIIKKRRLNLEKLDVKSFLQTQCIDKVGKG